MKSMLNQSIAFVWDWLVFAVKKETVNHPERRLTALIHTVSNTYLMKCLNSVGAWYPMLP